MQTKYGFSIGQTVVSKVLLYDERENLIPAGSQLRIVAIAPKVRKTNPFNIQNKPEYHDSKEYFFNAVLADSQDDFKNRIRANFVTIK